MKPAAVRELLSRHPARIAAAVALVVATVTVYARVGSFDFVTFDDDVYVYACPQVTDGLSLKNLVWSFTSIHANNWHPLTTISLLLDSSLFGAEPGPLHLVNLFFHAANTLLLLAALSLMTRSFWKSAFVAAVFALHPLHVESVAWVSERKDVLSAFFFMLTLLSYWWYQASPRAGRYLLLSCMLVLGLLAKPMLVTLPFVLLLLDFWPLERMGTGGPARMRALAYEKLPLVGMALALSVVTFAVQRTSGMVKSTGHVKLSDRLGNAIISYVSYLGDMLWPLHLSVFYPHPQHLLVAKAASAAVLLLAITGAALACMRKAPYLPVGWFWYLGTLFPVIGVVQVGAQARADRYTYLPLIGICIMVAWGVPRLVERFRYKRQALAAASLVLLALCALLTWRQVGYWKDSETLYTRAMEAVPGNYWAHHHLANALRDSGRTDEALAHYEECVKLYPGYAPASYEMGIIQLDRGNYKEAEDLFARVVKTDFNPAAAHYYLGRALLARNRADDAMRHFSESVRIDPGLAQSHMDLGRILAGKGSLGEARRHLEQGLKIRPNDEAGQTDLGLVLLRQGRLNEAIGRFTIAAEINPRFEKARTLLQQATLNKAALESTIRTLEDRLGGAPPQAQAYGISSRLAVLYSSLGEYDRSAEHLFRMLDMRPGDPGVSYNLACVRARQGRKDEAVKYLRQAVEKGFADFRLIRTDPDLESIRSDPYVASLLKGR